MLSRNGARLLAAGGPEDQPLDGATGGPKLTGSRAARTNSISRMLEHLQKERCAMTEFTLERRIPSCNVTKEFIGQVEEFLLNKVPQLANVSPDEMRKGYSVSLRDTYGTETMNSICHYRPDTFPDTLLHIEISTSTWPVLRIELRFDTDKNYSRIRIKYRSPQAREVVMGIYEGFRNLLEPHRNMHYIFHPPAVIDGVLGFLFFLTFRMSLERAMGTASMMGAAMSLLILTYWGARWLKPYVAFDTRRNRMKARWADWFIAGMASFIIFGTILPFLRKKFIGM